MEKLGYDFYEDNASQAINGNAGNLICKLYNSKIHAKSFLLAAHVDTITLSCENPIIKNDRIMSSNNRILGADDRVGLTVLLEILKLIANKKIEYPNLEIVFLVSEEIGLLGSKNLDYSKISATQGFNFDCSAPVGHVVVEAPIAIDFEIRFIGIEAHSAVAPEKGINAISMASDTISKINLPQKSEDTIFNIGKIKGGIGNNIIPGEVIVNGEIRSYNRNKIDQYLGEITKVSQSVVNSYRGRYELNYSLRYHSFKLTEEALVFKIAKAAIDRANQKFIQIRYLGGSDANIFNHKNITTVNIGLGYVNNHSSDEYIVVSDLVKDVEIGTRIVQIATTMEN